MYAFLFFMEALQSEFYPLNVIPSKIHITDSIHKVQQDFISL